MKWATYTMQELINEISMGPFGSDIKKSVYTNSGVPVLNGSNLQGFTLKENTFGYVSEEKADSLKKCNAHRGDIIVTHRGTLGQIVYIPNNSLFERYVISQSQFRFNLKPELARAEFIVYYFHTREGQHKILSNASQVGVPALARATTTFRQLEVKVPPLPVQDKIVGILSALDSKIENNNKINANLEAQAEALFKSWFVDFTPFKDQPFVDSELGPIPQGWKVGKLGDIALQSTEKVLTRNDVKVLSPITTGKLVLSEEYFTKQVFSKSIRNYKIVKQGAFAYNPARVNIGSLGMNEFKFDGCVSPVYVVFECLKGYSFFFDLFRKTEFFKQAVISFAIGGVRQTLNYSDFALIDATIPPLNIVQSFNEIYLHLKKKISINEEENLRLAALRDTLLPKLMSGEIKL